MPGVKADGGYSYQRWYQARRKLGMKTHAPYLQDTLTPAEMVEYKRLRLKRWREKRKARAAP